ncbi:MAG: DUF2017 family protein [Microbacteriaceae bacterium]|nr:DUF2017 family protein [Microbacteriaceae bacterium]
MIGFTHRGDRIVVAVDTHDGALLQQLIADYVGILKARLKPFGTIVTEPEDPVLRRLFPDPVMGDPFESIDVRTITEPSLIAHRLQNANAVLACLDDPGPLTDAQEFAWLKVLNDLRLVLSVHLGIVQDGDEGASETEEDLRRQAAYRWLGNALGDLLGAIEDRGPVDRPAIWPLGPGGDE